MTKEEKIKEAWCNQCLEQVNENGWLEIGYCVNGLDDVELWLANNYFKRNVNSWEIDYSELDNGEFVTCRIRPKSLQGIEDNNGWIKIESEEDLPKENVWLYNEGNNDLYIGMLFDLEGFPINRFATHYQPIVKPKPPIY